jgi:hypothetical protein
MLAAALAAAVTFSQYAADATRLLEASLYDGSGRWRLCQRDCGVSNSDWGADSLTYVAYLRGRTNRDSQLLSIFKALARTAETYHPCSGNPRSCSWSDVPEWDSIADSRIFEATGDRGALVKAEAAYAYVAQSKAFALGACPDVRYQLPTGGGGGLKTLETDANAIKAAILLYRETRMQQYLADAQRTYAAVRRRFVDPVIPLYTVYVFDNRATCTQVPHRFFASVNGDMIFNGLALYQITHDRRYFSDASSTVHAVDTYLSDSRGVFTDLQAENDIVEPLVEAMYDMATIARDEEARSWLIRNARAALLQDRSTDGYYGRFFDGPAPSWDVTAWQTNGGLALAIAAAVLDPSGIADGLRWNTAGFVNERVAALPSRVITFHGSGIAVIGAIGDVCCQPGHAGILLDGKMTTDETGIWENKSSSGLRIPNAVLFAWRWRSSGTHTIQFLPNGENAKEGGPYLNMTGYYVLP